MGELAKLAAELKQIRELLADREGRAQTEVSMASDRGQEVDAEGMVEVQEREQERVGEEVSDWEKQRGGEATQVRERRTQEMERRQRRALVCVPLDTQRAAQMLYCDQYCCYDSSASSSTRGSQAVAAPGSHASADVQVHSIPETAPGVFPNHIECCTCFVSVGPFVLFQKKTRLAYCLTSSRVTRSTRRRCAFKSIKGQAKGTKRTRFQGTERPQFHTFHCHYQRPGPHLRRGASGAGGDAASGRGG